MKINTKLFSSLNYRSIIVGVVMFISILAFLFTGFGKLNVFNFKGMDPTVALIVGSKKVEMSEFSRVLTSQGYSNSMPDNQKKYLISQILQNLIFQNLLLEEAQKIGFSANQDDIAAFIRTIPVFSDPTTKQFSLERFKQYLSSQQITDIEFFQKIKDDLTVRNLSDLIALPEMYPSSVAEIQYTLDHTEFYLQYALLQINPTHVEQQVAAQLNAFVNDASNQTDLQNFYDSKKSQYTRPTQYKVSSILISYKEAQRAQGAALGRNKQEAQTLIDSLLTKIQNGANFASVAEQTNDDVRAKQNKGELGYVDSTSIDPVSYKEIAQLSASQPLSSVIDTPFGFRIFKFEDEKAGFSKTFEQEKTNIAKELLTRKLKTTAQGDFENQVRTALTKPVDVSALNTLLAGQGIGWKSLQKPFTILDADVVELGAATPLVENVFYLKKPGEVLPKVLDFGSSKHVIFKLVSMRKPNNPSVSDIKELQKKESDSEVREFFQTYLTHLKESYEAKGKIKINPALLQ